MNTPKKISKKAIKQVFTEADRAKRKIRKMKDFNINEINEISRIHNLPLQTLVFWYNAIHC